MASKNANLIKRVLDGESKKGGFDIGGCNTKEIFEDCGIVSEFEVLREPRQDKYGYRRQFQFENLDVLRSSDSLDAAKLPTTGEWNEELIQELVVQVEKSLHPNREELIGRVKYVLGESEGRGFNKMGATQAVDRNRFSKALALNLKPRVHGVIDIEEADETNQMLRDIGDQVDEVHSATSGESANNQIVTSKAIWFGIDCPPKFFTGRIAELKHLHESFTRKSGKVSVMSQVTVVCGYSGIGKSTLAKAYAQANYEYYKGNGIWIDSTTKESFRVSIFRLFHTHFKISEEAFKNQNDGELLKIVCDAFSTRPCLIILDNMEDCNVLELLPKSWSPTANIPRVLVTSRQTTWRDGVTVLNLDLLCSQDAVTLVNTAIGGELDQNHVLKLVETLNCFPLALQLAVAYIRSELAGNSSPILNYLKHIEDADKTRDFLRYRNKIISDEEKTTFITLNLTMQNLATKEFGPLAFRIMRLISYFQPAMISTEIFVHLTAHPNPFQKRKTNMATQEELDGAILLLKKYSIITAIRSFGVEFLNMHQLVQRVIQATDKLDDLKTALEIMYNTLTVASDTHHRPLLLLHADSVWKHSLQHNDLVRDHAHFPMLLLQMWSNFMKPQEMLGLVRDYKAKLERALGDKHPSVTGIMYWQASTFYREKEYAESWEILSETRALASIELSSYDRLSSQISFLVSCHLALRGEYEEAMQVFVDILPVQGEDIRREYSAYLPTLECKAWDLMEEGKLEDALLMAQHFHTVWDRVRGSEHQHTLFTMELVAKILKKKGNVDEALATFKQLYETQKKTKGETHKDTLRTLGKIGKCETELMQKKF